MMFFTFTTILLIRLAKVNQLFTTFGDGILSDVDFSSVMVSWSVADSLSFGDVSHAVDRFFSSIGKDDLSFEDAFRLVNVFPWGHLTWCLAISKVFLKAT